ncbi:PadR family transcriptional regulator [Phytohabitans suffuscus]
MAKVLRPFLEEPCAPRYGAELIKKTGIPSGTMYPLLKQLRRAGYVESWKEDVDASDAKRPVRTMYLITALGRREAHQQLTELFAQILPRPNPPTVTDPGGILGGA